MKVLVAMDEYNGIISSYDANRYVEEAVASQLESADIVQVPLFNGRRELLNAVFLWKSGTQYRISAHNAEMQAVDVTYGHTDDGLTVIEASQFLTGQAPHVNLTSYGLGEVIRHALDKAAQHIVISVGGIASYDGGAGMLEALGARFYDDEGQRVDMTKGARQIKHVRHIDTSDLDQRLQQCRIQVLVDFESKLYGKQSAIMKTYIEQQIDRTQAVEIDNLLWYLSELFKNEHQLLLGPIERGGAGGGTAATMAALFNAEINTSHELVDQITGLDQLVGQADLIIFGEGIDEQDEIIDTSSLRIAELCQKHDKVSVALCGTADKFERFEALGVTAMFNSFIEMPKQLTDFKMGIQLRHNTIQAIKLLRTHLPQ
ncbi:glycerate kinase [Staphylococcus schleiferi]|uniref:Glycerate kinase n=1 Tax=Staphylococcus coagulans TaxID=74706 RepID=A0ABU1EXK2_9STAP|nr:glycerate kinase [Staphylococcus coagulans]AKS69857.1 glycerate kinase [Staphylococcus schleiferi]AKS71976.1 glycerate kinase [Staphylococcus schleiferi]AKS74263.1 glycerate kinase [Staphylococcus schleiferi]MBA8761071.1 glycerate kinase [Staphylococcus coagulans]MBA8763955.1 glycerate kinase [Staphylococcus coagulans]